MAYLKPPAFTRKVFNPLAMRFGVSGVSTLVIPRRRGGELQRIPVIVATHNDNRYLVSTRGESDWVKNLRAAGGGALHRKKTVERFDAVEVPIADRAPIFAAYRERVGREAEKYFAKLPEPSDHPVFRVDARAGTSPEGDSAK